MSTDVTSFPTPASDAGPARSGARFPGDLARLVWPALALAGLILYNAVADTSFFDISFRDGRFFGTPIDILDRAAAPLAIVALGMTLVIATGGIDLSVGALVAIAGSVAATSMAQGTSMPLAMTYALLACCACGAFNGVLVAYVGVQPIVATLIMMVAGRGIALRMGQNVPIVNPSFDFLGNGHLVCLPFTITLALLALLATALLTRGATLGLFIQSIGSNRLASRYAGIPVRPVTFFVYVFCALCAGIAGLVVASDIRAADANNAGLYLELDAILAVVVGGTALTGGRFLLAGSVLGAVLIQTLSITIYRNDFQVAHALIVKALVVLAVCLLQSPEFRARLRLRRSGA